MLRRKRPRQDAIQTLLVWYRERFLRKHPGFQVEEVQAWADLTGDTNPIHILHEAAEQAGAGCLEVLCYGLASC